MFHLLSYTYVRLLPSLRLVSEARQLFSLFLSYLYLFFSSKDLYQRPGSCLHLFCSISAYSSLLETYIKDQSVLHSFLVVMFSCQPVFYPFTHRCTATIAAVYWQSSEESVEGQLLQTGSVLESKGAYTGKSPHTCWNKRFILT